MRALKISKIQNSKLRILKLPVIQNRTTQKSRKTLDPLVKAEHGPRANLKVHVLRDLANAVFVSLKLILFI